MGKKQFQCKACEQKHEKPIDDECPFVDSTQEEGSEEGSDIQLAQQAPEDADDASDISDSVGNKILDKLIDMDNRLKILEHKKSPESVHTSGVVPVASARRVSASAASATVPATTVSRDNSGLIIPELRVLSSPEVQRMVDDRVRDLNNGAETGRYKSQRGGETVYVKKCVKWPQNFVVSGPNTSRVSYDQLNPFTFISGFAAQIKDEHNVQVKDAMLQYFSELFEDANDFTWIGAKNCHAAVWRRRRTN